MKHMIAVLVTVAVVGIAVQTVSAADVTGAVDVNTAYVWRGMTFNDGLVAQPYIDITKGGFGLNVWGNLDIDDYDDTLDSGEFSEIDLSASYGFALGSVDLGIGYIEYLFPTTEKSGAEGTREVYLNVGLPLPAGFSMALDIYRDIDELNETYISVGVDYSYDFSDQLNIGAGASLAYAGDEYCLDGSAGLYDYNLRVSIGYDVTEALNVSAFIKYTDSLDKDNLADVEDGGMLDVSLYGGVGVAYSF